jgi:hypothetical protein
MKTLTPVTSAACWQGYLAPTGLTGLGVAVPAAAALTPAMFASALSSAPATSDNLAAAAAAHVQAVAGVEQVATAPKQADKPNATRNDVTPLGSRPGAPPGWAPPPSRAASRPRNPYSGSAAFFVPARDQPLEEHR